MRNLKRALSLALAFVMVMSMMVVGAGAVSIDDFSDKDQIVNTEAVMTMVSLGVINGKDNGSYDPTGIVTRAEMAKLISVTLNGGKDPTLGAITANFTDTKGHWAESYIAYVSSLGIVDGRGDGTFGPNDQVTGAQAAKMILTMLGYRSDIEGFTGANWAINVQLKGNSIDLFDGLSINPDEGLTRDETAQMLYNAVQANLVEYRNLEGSYDGIVYPQPLNGVHDSTVLWEKFKVQKVEGVAVANDIMAIDNHGTTVAGKARLNDIYVGGTHREDTNGALLDDVYPVSLDNSYLGQRVVLYVKGLKNLAPNAASTQVVGLPIISQDNTVASTTKRLKDADAVRSFLSDNSLSLPAGTVASTAVNGTVTYSDNDTVYGAAAPSRDFAVTSDSNVNGTRLTFIDHNGDGVVDYIFKTLPKMAKVTVYNETDKALTIAGEGKIEFSDIANEADVAKDDIVLYYIMNETYYLEKAETVSGKVESYNDNNKTVVIDGTSYGKSTVQVETSGTDLEEYGIEMPMVGNTYTFYLDNNGNVVAWILGEESVGNYALILSSDDSGSAVVTKGEVKLLLADGSVVTGNVNLLASANKFADTKVKGSTEAKESAMAAKLADNKMANTLVTYVIGEDKTITIGDPTTVSKQFYNIAAGSKYAAPTQPVQRSTASYTFTPVARTTASDVTVSVNDSTLFFIRNVGGTGYSVVKGVSKLPTTALKKDNGDPATVSSVIYTDTSANPKLAKAVFVEADYQGTASYLYVTASYTGTLSVNGEQVYTYPVVFEDGTEGTVNADGSSYDDGLVYEYTVDSNGVAHLDSTVAPSNGKSGVVNGYVSTFAKGQNITLANGKNPADTRSYTVLANANLWNVEGKPYKETLTSNMTVALVIDADGFVKTAFVKDTSVTKGNVEVDAALTAKGVGIESTTVFSGFKAQFNGFIAGTKNVDYTYELTMDNGKKTTETGKNATITAEGFLTISMPKNATSVKLLTVTNSAIAGDDGQNPPEGKTWTLTLKGSNFIADTGNNATVWTGANTEIKGTPVTEFGVATSVTFNVPKDATVTVADDDITAGSYLLDNGEIATAKAGSMTFKMTSDVTIDETKLANAKVFAIHTDDDVQLLEVATSTGADDVKFTEINGVYYIDSASAQYLTVKTTNADAVIAVAAAKDVKVAASGLKITGTKAAAGAELNMTSAITADVYLYAASEVTFSNLTAKVGDTALTTGDYVKVGETVVSTITATNGTGVIADTTGSTKVGTNVAAGYVVGNDDVELVGAFKVTLNDATVQASDGTALKSGDFVKKADVLKTAAPATGKGTAVIDTTTGNLHAASAYTGAALNGDLTLSAAVKLDVTTNSGEIASIEYISQPSGKPVELTSDGTADAYIVPGTEIEVTGTAAAVTVTDSEGEIEITGDNRDDTTFWVKLTVGTADLEFSAS